MLYLHIGRPVALAFFFKKKPVEINKEIRCITNRGKKPRMNGKIITLTFFELYTVYIKNWDNSFFHTYSLTCLKEVLLKVINI